MIKKTLCFSNPAYLSLRDAQLVIKLPEVEKAANLTEDFKKSTEVTRPIEDIGVVVLDHKQVVYAGAKILIFSKSQHPPRHILLPFGCLCRCKDTNFLANHNIIKTTRLWKEVVYIGAKIQIF